MQPRLRKTGNQKLCGKNNNLIISHALTFAAGLIIHSLFNTEDCGDVVMKALKNAKNDNKIQNPPPTAKASLRLEPQTVQLYAPAKAKEKEGRKGELNFFDIGITTGTDKVLGEKNLPLCLKDDKACGQPQQVIDECKWFYCSYFRQGAL